MKRRDLLVATGCAFSGAVAGCQSTTASDAEITAIELENHRTEAAHEFSVRIDRDEETVYETTRRLRASGSDNSTAVLDRPVEGAGDYEVFVSAGAFTESVHTRKLLYGEQTCLHLEFYLGDGTLHWERTNHNEC
ncbi:hypothetical protein [Halapricum salinum]|uniref:Uncharacterized protein n=1 Tax=Halapricum salinum TaxID=1457250 RepID=A0A4D6H9I3_9EURY|nr:hypothetical protein [Halapricum salinum]QCC50171.1 hypothetical protein DV733_02520 [Halapricum salinum]